MVICHSRFLKQKNLAYKIGKYKSHFLTVLSVSVFPALVRSGLPFGFVHVINALIFDLNLND